MLWMSLWIKISTDVGQVTGGLWTSIEVVCGGYRVLIYIVFIPLSTEIRSLINHSNNLF
jgi:hypothetical protein